MKKLRYLVHRQLVLILLLALPGVGRAQFTWTNIDGAVTITGYTGPGGAITIPATIDGLPVRTIGLPSSGGLTPEEQAVLIEAQRQRLQEGSPGNSPGANTVTRVTVDNGALDINSGAFEDWTELGSVSIPASVTNIEVNAFLNCPNLTNLTVAAGNRFYSSVDGVLFDKQQKTLLLYPSGRTGSYSIPTTVTRLASFAFGVCPGLTGVVIPQGVSTIASNAFGFYTNLTAFSVAAGNPDYRSVNGVLYNKSQTTLLLCPGAWTGNFTVPPGVTTIGMDAFEGCAGLTGIALPGSLISLGNNAFADCNGLTNVVIPDRVTSLGIGAFDGCQGLVAVTLGQSVTNLGADAFSGCSKLAAINLPDSLTSIGLAAFQLCYALEGITIPNGVTSIAASAFSDTGLTNVVVGSGVTVLADEVFANDSSLTNVTLTGRVTSFGQGVFEECSGLRTFTIPDSVTNLGSSVLAGTSLTSITIPTNVVSIGVSPFGSPYYGTGVYGIPPLGIAAPLNPIPINTPPILRPPVITNTVVPTTLNPTPVVTTPVLPLTVLPTPVVQNSVMAHNSGSPSLQAINVAPGNPAYESVNGVLFNRDLTTLIEYPYGLSGSYTIPDGVTIIETNAFADAFQLTGITIPAGMTSIGDNAFEQCSELGSVTVPDSVTNLGNGVFEQCAALTNAVIGQGVTSLGIQLFQNCHTLAGVTLEGQVASIGTTAFNSCQDLASLTLPDGLLSIGVDAFMGAALTNLTIPASVTNIGVGAFAECIQLTAITVAAGNLDYSSAGGALFDRNQTTLLQSPGAATGVYAIPSTVTSIGNEAFQNCHLLNGVTVPAGVTNLGTEVFWYDYDLTNVFFAGNAPASTGTQFENDNNTVTYAPGASGWTNTFGGVPAAALGSPAGALRVTIEPADFFLDEEADWEVDGGISHQGNQTVKGLTVGNHTVSFSTVPGWTNPASQMVWVTANATNSVNETYAVPPAPGYLQVSIGPATAVSAGAQWRVNGGGWQSSGAVVSSFATNAAVAFNTIADWTSPAVQTVALSPGQTNVLTVNYRYDLRPTLRIGDLAAGLAVSNTVYTITGKASDNAGVASVWYQLNGGGWSNAMGTTNWSATVTLTASNNTFQAYAVDVSGNVSATNMVTFRYIPSAILQLQTVGEGTISPDYSNAVLAVGGHYHMTATAVRGSGFAFTNWTVLNIFNQVLYALNEWGQPVLVTNVSTISPGSVATNGPTLTFTMPGPTIIFSNSTVTLSQSIGYEANFVDVEKPVLHITTPTPNEFVTNFNFLVQGTASDNAAVASVWYQFNGGGWATANGTNQWSVPVSLTPGTNTIQAYAMDTSGNVSATNMVNFVYVFKMPFFLTIKGLGTVTPNYSGQQLQVGENYTMKAVPAKGFGFTNWYAVSLIQPLETAHARPEILNPTPIIPSDPPFYLTNSPTLQFTMGGFLEYIANFVDITPPVVTITAPKPNERVSNTVFTVTGTARDNVGVAGVYYQLNGAGWQSASTGNGYTNWFTPTLPLLSATQNILQVYAMDTSSNVSPTTTVDFDNLQQDPAPESLAGMLANGASFTNGGFTFDFGTNTFSLTPYIYGQTPSVGQYTYAKLTPTNGQLSFASIAPPSAVGGAVTLDLAFTSRASGTYSNENSGDTGTILFSPTFKLISAGPGGKTMLLFSSNGVASTLAFAGSTVNFTNTGGDGGSANYAFQPVSPISGLLTWGDARQGTNYLVLLSDYTNIGAYYASDYDAEGNARGLDSGIYALPASAVSAPASPAGTEAQTHGSDGSESLLAFGAGTYSQYGYTSPPTAGTGTYSYVKNSSADARLNLAATGLPGNTNGGQSVQLNFVTPQCCWFTNQAAPGSNVECMVFFPVTATAPTKVTDLTLYATNYTERFLNNQFVQTVDVISFLAHGFFSQVETAGADQVISSGTWQYQVYSPVGAVLQLKYTSPDNLAGATNYLQATFYQSGSGILNGSFYDSAGDPAVTSVAGFSLH